MAGEDLMDNGNGTMVGQIDYKEYYQLEAQSEDWQYLLQSAVVKYKLTNSRNAFIQFGKKFPVFYIAREKIDAPTMAKIIGYKGNPSDLERDVIIHLKPIGDQSGWEKPTVEYIGEA